MFRSLRGLLDPGDWRAVKPRLDPAAPALRIDYAPSAGEVKLRIWSGAFVLVIAGAVGYWLWDDFIAIFVIAGLVLFGVLNLVYAFLQGGFTLTLAITERSVAFDSRTRFGWKSWQEPLANYRGVLLRETQTADRGIDSIDETKRFHIIELAHADPGKCVTLYVKEGDPPPRDIQDAFARRFRLAALAPEEEDGETRPAAAPGPPPSGVKIENSGGTTRVRIEPGRVGRLLVWVTWLCVPAVFSAITYQIEPAFVPYAAGLSTIFVLMMLGMGAILSRWSGPAKRAICIDAARLWIEPSGNAAAGLPRESIERIRVDSYLSHSTGGSTHGTARHGRLLIEAASTRIEYIGSQFEGKRLAWVRDYLRYRLANRV